MFKRHVKLFFFLFLVLTLSCAAWVLPHAADIDFYRPRITEQLEKLLGRKVSIGPLSAQLLPQPGILVTDVTVYDPGDSRRAVANISSMLIEFHLQSIFELKPRVKSLHFERPRFFLKRSGKSWIEFYEQLSIPKFEYRQDAKYPLDTFIVNNGEIEFTDQVPVPTLHHSLRSIVGQYQLNENRGNFRAETTYGGDKAQIHVAIRKNSQTPVICEVRNLNLGAITQYYGEQVQKSLAGNTDLDIILRLDPNQNWDQLKSLGKDSNLTNQSLTARVSRVQLQRFPGIRFAGQAIISTTSIQASAHTLGTSPIMTAFARIPVSDLGPNKRITMEGSLHGIAPEIVRPLFKNPYLQRFYGKGRLNASLVWNPLTHQVEWTMKGGNFSYQGCSLKIRSVTLIQDRKGLSVRGTVAGEREFADVTWAYNAKSRASRLEVDAHTIQIRQILEIFNLQNEKSPQDDKPGTLRPYGHERIILDHARLKSRIVPNQLFEIQEGYAQLAGGTVNLKGTIIYSGRRQPTMHLEGSLHDVESSDIVSEFFYGPPIISGVGGANFDLTFRLSRGWLHTLDGNVVAHLENGVVYSFKTLYRILALTNLTNYLTGSLPKTSAKGIPFDGLAGTLQFTNGIMKTEDLFLNSKDMKVAGFGTIDFPHSMIHAQVNVQVLRFIENIITNIPGIRWMFKGGHKILLPLPVTLDGPFHNIQLNKRDY